MSTETSLRFDDAMAKVLQELDTAARANLGLAGVERYRRYKAELLADETTPDDMDIILRGFIWGEIEQDAASDEDDDEA